MTDALFHQLRPWLDDYLAAKWAALQATTPADAALDTAAPITWTGEHRHTRPLTTRSILPGDPASDTLGGVGLPWSAVYAGRVAGSTPLSAGRMFSADASLSNGAWGLLSWGTALWDATPTPFWQSAQPTRLTAPESGQYLLSAVLQFAPNASGDRIAMARRDAGGSATGGADLFAASTRALGTAGYATVLPLVGVVALAAGQYVEVFGLQNSGGALAVTVVGTQLALVRMV